MAQGRPEQRHDGVYLATDVEYLRPMHSPIERLSFFAGRVSQRPVCASIIGVTPDHLLLREVIASLPVSSSGIASSASRRAQRS
ncbi:MAG: hypothetical protein ABSH07_07135 [Candidatus Dormibacteria bacterium]|jgi:hypothetical protein